MNWEPGIGWDRFWYTFECAAAAGLLVVVLIVFAAAWVHRRTKRGKG